MGIFARVSLPVTYDIAGMLLASPSGNVVVFLFIAERSVDELFRPMHYFLQPVVGLCGFAPKPPPGIHPWTPLGDFRPQPPNLPTPEKILRAPVVQRIMIKSGQAAERTDDDDEFWWTTREPDTSRHLLTTDYSLYWITVSVKRP